MAPQVDVSRFYNRLGKVHAHFVKHRDGGAWGGATAVSLNRGALDEDKIFVKSIIIQQYLFGYELPETIIILTYSGKVLILGTKKKIEFLQPIVGKAPSSSSIKDVKLLLRNKTDENAENFLTMLKDGEMVEGTKVGVFLKEKGGNEGASMVVGWEKAMDSAKVTYVDISAGVSLAMSIKEDMELDLLKKASVLSNKVLKHGVIPRIEEIIDSELSVTHEAVATEIDAMIEDPSKINLKVPKEHVQSCYFPIVQSGGDYDIKISAQSSNKPFKYDIILASLGARYQMYCSNVCRTFLVDPPKKVSQTYETLLSLQGICLENMVPGRPLKAVYLAAVKYLKNSGNDNLIKHLPKNLGFATGLDFRESSLVLNPKNPAVFRPDMVFVLTVGFVGLPLSSEDKSSVSSKSASKNLETFALLVGDMVTITTSQSEVLTKHSKDLSDISYTINDEDGDASSSDGSGAARSKKKKRAPDGDEAYARSVATSQVEDTYVNGTRQRKSTRLAGQNSSAEAHEGKVEREKRQVALMARKNEERLRELARAKSGKKDSDDPTKGADELVTYEKTKEYPEFVLPNQVKVDMARECIILPICGNPVPFHISTVKNVVLPDPDAAAYLRLNFYSAGATLGKDTPVNIVRLVQKYAPFATFIREMTFRSLDPQSLTHAYRQILELRKRCRQRELRELEEANLVKQEKLIRTKNERVPRLSDLTMRPVFAGKKTQGNLEAHTNGLRFISTRHEILDIMYNNIKYAIFQPCESEIMVLVHFHLRNPILVGRKRQKDIQFYTEVIDASLQVDGGRRSMADPDEMDDEQRERQLRKRLNEAFKEFCRKVENVARKNGHTIEFDIPYRDLGFYGTPSKEMVTVQPTLHCLINLTETPFFVVDLGEVDHVHFERVTFMSKAFDIVLINKNFTMNPWRVDMIPSNEKDSIQEWLTDMEISYTEGPMNLNWKQIMITVAGDDRFYMNTHEDEVTEKDAGWEFLRMFGKDDEEGEDDDEDDSHYSENQSEEAGSDESEEDESDFDSESEESDYDGDEDLEEQGMDWEEMEREAAADDRKKRRQGGDDESDGGRRKKKQRMGAAPQRRRGSAAQQRRGGVPQQRRGSAGQQRRRR
mmetsp:Transcript_10616/g.13105  ORF Transcript_10616/g.13105 Transcript_10616/m.13105 type:complete len:1111 (-) Transcript_10616:134-3466(-)|eukprot:CAMPEP_0172495934 /NCGR_PEP_ID=MMETSP1066-20121228/79739_1 /TAXON_ID=671091 /ORGANISM="Coscinodiscus wailesii, Strain CCMP2513" /LENGTH=1110 /DNA_ID=CAMNT_0013267955 /DNA_START=213 /DNA_END=3545 /DNA_ORIENTATION=-